jgi:predicted nuclease of predicted toxin-antitoxin system
VDECAGPALAQWLIAQGHDVFSVYDEARGVSDDEVIQKAWAEDRIIITIDKDFGDLIFRDRHPHKGVILLRLNDERSPAKIAVMKALLETANVELENRFVVATEHTVRIAGIE